MDLISNLPICNRPSPTLVLPVPYVGYVTSHLAFFPICRISSSLCSSRLISSHLITSICSKRREIYISLFWYRDLFIYLSHCHFPRILPHAQYIFVCKHVSINARYCLVDLIVSLGLSISRFLFHIQKGPQRIGPFVQSNNTTTLITPNL